MEKAMLNPNRQYPNTPPANGIRQHLQLPRRVDGFAARERAPLPAVTRPSAKIAASAPVLDTPSVPGMRVVSPIRKWWRSRGAGQTAASATSTGNVGNGSVAFTAPSIPPRKRRRVERVWPEVGTILRADYLGQTYHAEVVQAWKPLKSGKQLRILDGSAAGKRANSFSRAMLKATSRQRRENKLGVKGLCGGWTFWRVTRNSELPDAGLAIAG